MLLISHRGNVTGPQPQNENLPWYIQAAIDDGYDVEMDVWMGGGLFLGHDGPEHPIEMEWLSARRDRLWVHAKDFAALDAMLTAGMRVFYHLYEKHTVIGNTQLAWSHDLSEASGRSIVPMLSAEDVERHRGEAGRFHGVCSDYVERLSR